MAKADVEIRVGVDDKATTKLKGIGNQMQRMSSTFKKAGIGMMAAGAALGGGLIALGKMAADFEGAMREVNTMIGLSEEGFQALSSQVQDVSSEVGKSSTELSGALYQIVSAGIDAADAIMVLEVAAKAAVAGVTDTETAADGLTTILNAFKISAKDAGKVADVMFTVVKRGKTNFEQLSASIFQVAPIAATAGVKFEEVAAALATLTKQGIPTSVATTQLRQAIVALLKPTDVMKGAINKLGYESGEALLEEEGLAGALNDLTKVAQTGIAPIIDYSRDIARLEDKLKIAKLQQKEFTQAVKESTVAAKALQISELSSQLEEFKIKQKNASVATSNATETLGEMFGSVEALGAVLSLTGENAQTFAEDLVATTEESAGAVEEAYEEMNKGIGRQFEIIFNELKVMGEEIGATLLPVFKDIIDKMKPIIQSFKDWVEANKDLIPQLLKVAVVLIGVGGVVFAMSQIAMALQAVNLALVIFHSLSGPAGWIKLAAGIAIAGGAVFAITKLMGGFGGGGGGTTGTDIWGNLPGSRAYGKGPDPYKPPPQPMHGGGIVQGPIGQPVPVMALGGERFGGGGREEIHIYLNMDGERISEVIYERLLQRKARNATLELT